MWIAVGEHLGYGLTGAWTALTGVALTQTTTVPGWIGILGILIDDDSIAVDSNQATTIDRVYVAGNCSEPRALVPAATGSGATAAVAINARLSFEDADSAVAPSSTAARSH